MTLERDNKTTLKRRRFIKTAAGLTLAPIAIGLWGCGSSDSNSTTSDTNGSTGSDDSTDNGSDTSTDGWASGALPQWYLTSQMILCSRAVQYAALR